MDWPKDFTNRCISKLQTLGDQALVVQKHDEAVSVYSTTLSLTPPPPKAVH